MDRTKTIRIGKWAQSTIEIYAEEDWSKDAPEIALVIQTWRRGGSKNRLVVLESEAFFTCAGLTMLSNTEDENAQIAGHPEGRQFARKASDSLTCAQLAVLTAFRT